MRVLRLAVPALAVAFAACAGDAPSPVEVEAPAGASVPGHPFGVTINPTSLVFAAAGPGEMPQAQHVTVVNPYGLIASTGLRVGPIQYIGQSGWLLVGVQYLGLTARVSVRPSRIAQGSSALIPISLPGGPVSWLTVNFGEYFRDNAESLAGWTATGLWNLYTTAQLPICNTARPGECLPPPFQGNAAFWYGSPTTGNFNFGNNAGDLTSPVFSIPQGAISPELRFDTWYEIEYDVSPVGFDWMQVYMVNAFTAAETLVGVLNLLPGFVGHTGLPNLQWIRQVINLSAFRGGTWRLRFRFETFDGSFNDYRGWGLDNIRVVEASSPPAFAQGSSRAGILSALDFDGTPLVPVGPPLARPMTPRR
jgi:hypothetical protein